ncbi:DUF5711 family protein [Papillibacter cinnamivorans]|uniref:Uncharacterized protein n=1 Tax=Papillibacter cinnamivorans DSM 12816 TaxID=1122930 RepID=A0A1W2B8W2_9FIRM|nr:DUF5711 family protein [Papillibacter cinnamivorans]SMC68808.1 hypothetical protein SAMN02745168_2064 [Papillibacter cinnamivorans DSM 12816]
MKTRLYQSPGSNGGNGGRERALSVLTAPEADPAREEKQTAVKKHEREIDDGLEENGSQPERPEKKRRSFARRVLSVAVTAAVVLGALALVVFHDRLNIDSLRRAISYISLRTDDSGRAEEFSYEGDAGNRFVTFKDGLLVASGTRLQLFSAGGKELYSGIVALDNPRTVASKTLAAAYDVGGGSLYALDGDKVVLELHLDSGLSIFSASVNDGGYLAVTCQENGYKGKVTVYNDKMGKAVDLLFSTRFVVDACVLPDCKTAAAVTIGQEEDRFESTVGFYSIASGKQTASLDIPDSLVLSLGNLDGSLCAVTETSIVIADENGEKTGEYGYSDRYLREFDLGGDGFASVVLSRYKAGTQAKLVTVDGKGNEIASLDTTEEILDISAAGRYVAVLYASRLVIYTKDMKEYARLEGTAGARSVLMRDDGTAMLVGYESARLYIP